MLPVNLKIYRTQTPDTKFDVSGNTNGSVIIITKGSIDTVQSHFLKNILASVKINSEDVLKISVSDDSVLKLKKMVPGNKEYIIVIFGCTPEQLGMNMNSRLNQVIHISHFSLIFTYSLEQLDKSVVMKKELWTALKQVFLKDD